MNDLLTRLRAQFNDQYAIRADGCWIWTGPRVRAYGIIKMLGGQIFAHRFSYEMFIGPINGLDVHHHWHTSLCVNPDHLETMSHRDNLMLSNNPTAVNARKTHCKRGHPFSKENTVVTPGRRRCRTCTQIRDRGRRKGQQSVV